jgi:hypothetical protein
MVLPFKSKNQRGRYGKIKQEMQQEEKDERQGI